MAKASPPLNPPRSESPTGGATPDGLIPLSATARPDFLWRVIQRYDGYANGANTKAAIVLTFNSFAFAAVFLKWDELSGFFGSSPITTTVASIIASLCAIAALVSLWLGLNAVIPVLRSTKEPKKYHSLVFFQHVAEFGSAAEYVAAVTTATPDELAEDLARQTHAIAQILAEKFWYLTWSTRLVVFVELPAFLVLVLMLASSTFFAQVGGGN